MKTKKPEVVYRNINDLHFASEAPKHIKLQVRMSSDRNTISDAELEGTLRKNGVLIPMFVAEREGKLYVTAGNRRLRLMRKISEGSTSPVTVPTYNSDDFEGDVREIAMATNVSLPPHPVDRLELITMLIKDGMTPEDAKLSFGMSERQFQQTLRYGVLSPAVRDAWRTNEIDAKTAQAFTLTSDHKEQDKVLNTERKSWRKKVEEHAVRSALIGTKQRDVGRFVTFVGVETVKAAKILKRDDLFANDHTVTDTKALQKLVTTKIKTICEQLTADNSAGGWAWAQSEDDLGNNRHYYGQINPSKAAKATPEEQARIDQVLHELKAFEDNYDGSDEEEMLQDEHEQIERNIKSRGYTPEQRKKAGCIISVGRDGSLKIDYGRVKPEEKKRVEASERKRATPAKKPVKLKPGEAMLTGALARRLSEGMQEAGADVLRADHRLAVSALIAGFASSGHVVHVSIGGGDPYREAKKKALDFSSVFAGAMKSTNEQLLAMLAQVAADALSIDTGNPDRMPLTDKAIAEVFQAMMPAKVKNAIREHFDAKDYFESVSTEACAGAVAEAMGEEQAAKVRKMKKADAAKFAAANVGPTDWLPLPLRTAHYDFKSKALPVKAPAAKAAAPKAKKKPAKKAAKKSAK